MFARLRRLIVYLAAADFLGTLLALWLADYARRLLPLGAPIGEPLTLLNPAVYLIVSVVYPLAFLALSVYDLRRDTRPVGDASSLARALVVGMFVFAGVLYFSYRDVDARGAKRAHPPCPLFRSAEQSAVMGSNAWGVGRSSPPACESTPPWLARSLARVPSTEAPESRGGCRV